MVIDMELSITIIPEERAKLAHDLFFEGYNCAQSVAVAFCDVIGMDKNDVARLISGFGGGFSRMRDVCGAVCGGVFVLNALFGGFALGDIDGKAEHYALIQRLMKTFADENGSYICRELLSLKEMHDSPIPEKRTAEYYRTRPCADLAASCARITAKMIIEHK